MALNFPSSPSVGDTYTDTTSGFSYEWDGTVWKSYASASASNIKVLDDISGSFDGSTQTFALAISGVSLTPASAQQLRIVLGGVVQSPGVDYTVSSSNITFTTAPDAALDFSGVSLGPAVPVTYANDGNIYVRNTYTGAGTTGPFAFAQGYTIGYLDVYRNGVRLSSGTDFVGTSGTNFFLTDAAAVDDELEAIGYTVTALISASSNLDNLNVTGIGTIVTLDVNGAADLTQLKVTGVSTVGVVTGGTYYGDGSNLTGVITGVDNINITGVATAASFSGNLTGNVTGNADTATTATNAQGLTGTPDITVGSIVGSALTISGISTLTDLRLASIADKTTIVDGNTVSLSYSSGGGNVAICTNPSGAITLNVTNIPTTSDFDNRAISFAIIVQQGATAYACTSVSLNGVSFSSTYTVGTGTHIAYSGGTVATGNTSSYDTFNFTGINIVGSASTTTNYKLLSNVNGDYRLY